MDIRADKASPAQIGAAPAPLASDGPRSEVNPAASDEAPARTAPRPQPGSGHEAETDAHGTAETDAHGIAAGSPPPPPASTPLSKNQQKKLKRQQKWEGMRDDRKRRRKEKRVAKQAEKRAAKAAEPEGGGGGGGGSSVAGSDSARPPAVPPKERTLVPVSFIFDCAFEAYMRETEQISLAGQITRSYAANRTAARGVRIYVSSWGGKLQTRYETLLANQHKRWSDVFFVADDFAEAARQADAAMRGPQGGTVVDVLAGGGDGDGTARTTTAEPAVVYLTSDSPHTLTRLEPYTSYVIGGIVDKNREKGLCYGRAQARGIRTAKLPIGDYMVMASRQVLTTNHVAEIMLSWLETGDWATAFANVIPKRKGGHLRASNGTGQSEVSEDHESGGDREEDEAHDDDGGGGNEFPPAEASPAVATAVAAESAA